MKNLPQNWVIDTHKEKDSPLMPKFIEWFLDNKNGIYQGVGEFLGFYNGTLNYWRECRNKTVITLEQWNAFYFTEWEPKQGERVFASNFRDDIGAYERVFVVKHNETYYCEDNANVSYLVAWKYIKPLQKESILQPIMDKLKVEAEKLGLKVNITVE